MKLQEGISTSTMMTEYYALSTSMREVLPLHNLMLGFGVFSHEWWFNLATKLVFSFWPLSGPIISSFKHSEQITS